MAKPILLIGIGGAGSEILFELSNRYSLSDKNDIRFVTIDTDINSLTELREAGFTSEIIATSTKVTVGEELSKNEAALNEWFPINKIVNRKTLTEGAGQIRAISRLAFDSLIHTGGINNLHKAITELYHVNGDQFLQSLHVMIVGSLAGGTGSGILLYLGMYIRNYIKQNYNTDSIIIRGFFLTADIFKSNIEKATEQVVLQANSYATLKELNGFFLKADDKLPKRYKSIIFEGKEYGIDQEKEYSSLPYDFCFLYDDKNLSSENLKQKSDYIKHAANCIYALLISPMSAKANSLEDNQIIPLCKSEGKNRYCGAGQSEIIFPVESVVSYLSLVLKKAHLSNQWLKYDDDYLKKKKIKKEMAEKGIFTGKIELHSSYIDSVNHAAKNGDPFSNIILEENRYFKADESSNIFTYKFQNYLNILERAAKNYTNQNEVVKNSNKIINNRRGQLENSDLKTRASTLLNSINNEMIRIKNYILTDLEIDARNEALNFFYTTISEINENNLEYWIQNMQPNSVRYFLYNLKKEIFKKKKKIEFEIDTNLKNKFINYDTEIWSYNNSTTTIHGFNEFCANYRLDYGYFNRKKNIINKREYINIIDNYKILYEKYIDYTLNHALLEECLKIVDRLCKRFEMFYKEIENNIKSINYEITKYEKLYTVSPVTTTRYVCCDEECLKYFSKIINDNNMFYEIPTELANTINKKICSDQDEDGTGLKNICKVDMEEYYHHYFEENYSNIIGMTIVEAMKQEALIKLGKNSASNVIERYVTGIINSAYRLAEPFIACSNMSKDRTFTTCTYNNEIFLNEKRTEYDYVIKLLESHNAIESSEHPNNSIMFYRAIYGLSPEELIKFIPENIKPTYSMYDGMYYKSYYSIVKDIGSGTGKDYYDRKTITPHISYNWHSILLFPELTPNAQKNAEKKLYDALIYGFVNEKICYKSDEDGTDVYFYNQQPLIGSKNNSCKSFYEIIDALACDISKQDSIIESVKEIENLDNSYKNFDKIRLYDNIKKLRIECEVLKNDSNKSCDEFQPMSLYIIALLYRITCPRYQYDASLAEGLVDEITDILMGLIKKYVVIGDQKDVIKKVYEVQFGQFYQHYDKLKKSEYDFLENDKLKQYVDSIKNEIQKENNISFDKQGNN